VFGYSPQNTYLYRYAAATPFAIDSHIIRNTLTFSVKTTAGAAISGASVVMVDKYGTTVFTDVTDANGALTKTVDVYRSDSKANGTAGYPSATNATIYDYNPFVITISKAGYQNAISQLTINDPTTIPVGMLATVPDTLTVSALDVTHCTYAGASDGTITAAGGGGTAPYEFSVDDGAAWQVSGNFINLPPGDYAIRVKDSLAAISGPINIAIVEPQVYDTAPNAEIIELEHTINNQIISGSIKGYRISGIVEVIEDE
jgi:hypothetical protein